MSKIAVFGTLKKGHGNNWRMQGDFLGEGQTKDKLALHGLMLFDTREVAPVAIELYDMRDEDIVKLVDPIEMHAYDRKKKTVVVDGVEHEADMYVSFARWDRGKNDELPQDGVFNYTGLNW